MRVGIIDSGLGGIVVLKTLLEQNKFTHYIYYGDYKHSPYGNKNDMQLQSYFETAMSFFLIKKCDLVIIACNTLSTIIEKNNYRFMIPLVFVKQKMLENKHLKTLVLATKKTVNCKTYHMENTIELACPLFVKQLEKNPMKDMKKVVHHYLKDLPSGIQCVVLGCTHYSLLKESILKELKQEIKVIDSSLELANQVNFESSKLKIDLYLTKSNHRIKKNIDVLLKKYPYKLYKWTNHRKLLDFNL